MLIAGARALEARRELVERLELMVSGVVAARKRRYLMLNAPRSALARIGAAPAQHGCAVGARRWPNRGRSRCTPPSTRTRSGTCSRRSSRRGVVDPRPAGGEARRMRGDRLDQVLPRSDRDRGRRPRREATPPCSTGRSGSTAQARPLRVPPERCAAARDGAGRARCRARARAMRLRTFCAPQRPADTSRSRRSRVVLAERRWCRSRPSAIYVPGGAVSAARRRS